MVQFSNNFNIEWLAEGGKKQMPANSLTVLLIRTAVNFEVILNTPIHLSICLFIYLSLVGLDQQWYTLDRHLLHHGVRLT